MHAGKLFSAGLVLMVAAVATAVRVLAYWAFSLESAAVVTRVWVFSFVVMAVSAMVLIPMGFVFDHALGKLRRHIEDAATTEPSILITGKSWLRPITRALTGVVDQFRQREQKLRAQLGDLEIRHRVSEAERRQVEAVLHALGDAVLVTDPFNEIVMANQAAATILGFDLQSGLHRPIDELIQDKRLCEFITQMRHSADFTNARHVEHTITNVASGSADRVYDVTLVCVENHKHDVGGVVTILHDRTRERELSQMKSDFVSKASHELRTPLSSIRGYVEMLVDGEFSDQDKTAGAGQPPHAGQPDVRPSAAEIYRIIQAETDRLGRLIDNMLNISRIEAGIVQIDRQRVDVKSLVARAVHAMETQAAERQISLHTRMSPVDLCVEGDADMLYQVVLNLLSNAVKYTPEGGRVTLCGDSDHLTRSVLVSVADTGLGIPPDALPKLFDKFFRIENYKRVAKGTGLGLSLCKHIVETVHHGQIGVESKLGMGSKFWFAVPMRYAGSKAAMAA